MVRQINYWAAGLACCLALLSHGSSPIKSSSQSQTQVVFLGTGTPCRILIEQVLPLRLW